MGSPRHSRDRVGKGLGFKLRAAMEVTGFCKEGVGFGDHVSRSLWEPCEICGFFQYEAFSLPKKPNDIL